VSQKNDPRKWFAHSGKRPDKTDWQSIQSHLLEVAQLASERSEVFGAKDFGYLIGLLHDLGKYTPEFQRRLEGSQQKTDHSTAGAKVVMQHIGYEYLVHLGALENLQKKLFWKEKT
jgi:CRISPR-associated endonuclease/helicase Cas3